MARTPRWKQDGYEKGVVTYTLSSWKYFHDFIHERKLLDFKTYVYRGQRSDSWLLEPSINRLLDNSLSEKQYKQRIADHLNEFKFSIRGRFSDLNEIIENENELWALGQHHGLKTPLLDFTYSPYVAAYFAFIDKEKLSEYRVIWAASQYTTNHQVGDELEIFRPTSGYNPRLISQSGLFVKFNTQKDMDKVIKETKQHRDTEIQLYKIRIPNKDRILCLRFLNRMNINHNTLFPDIYGSSIYCNTHLEIEKY